mmetsp:Transcript_115548/g.326640  ORF Transcript_115548/g.326640 Transcript_115548/m.326640 type:complete len:217 (+) Transcript_115548:1096-1746(+)
MVPEATPPATEAPATCLREPPALPEKPTHAAHAAQRCGAIHGQPIPSRRLKVAIAEMVEAVGLEYGRLSHHRKRPRARHRRSRNCGYWQRKTLGSRGPCEKPRTPAPTPGEAGSRYARAAMARPAASAARERAQPPPDNPPAATVSTRRRCPRSMVAWPRPRASNATRARRFAQPYLRAKQYARRSLRAHWKYPLRCGRTGIQSCHRCVEAQAAAP